MSIHARMRKQIILADRMVLTKTDLVAKDAVDGLAAKLRSMNPRASIDIAVDGALDPSRLI